MRSTTPQSFTTYAEGRDMTIPSTTKKIGVYHYLEKPVIDLLDQMKERKGLKSRSNMLAQLIKRQVQYEEECVAPLEREAVQRREMRDAPDRFFMPT